MKLILARTKAVALMRRHGLAGWELVFDDAKTRAGVCRSDRKEIGLSRVLTQLHTEAEVSDTILHEIAHALVGAHHGHDAVWRAKAREIGCSAKRCVPETAARPVGAWTGTCPSGHVTTRHRQPHRVQSCGVCSKTFDPSALVDWTHHGSKVPMHPRYLAELAGIVQKYGSQTASLGGLAAAARSMQAPPAPGLPGPSTVGSGGSDLDPAAGAALLLVGARVRLGGSGRYAGLVGTIEKRGRTRYHIRTSAGLVTAPFFLVEPL